MAQRIWNPRRNSLLSENDNVYVFHSMMQKIAEEMHQTTGSAYVFKKVPGQPANILDFCTMPSGFLTAALKINVGAKATAFSMPFEKAAPKIWIPEGADVAVKHVDIAMLAADMGCTDIVSDVTEPEPEPEAERERYVMERQLADDDKFGLIFCDGHVIHDAEERLVYRTWWRKQQRISTSHLALGLEHLVPGGTLIMLLTKPEGWGTAGLISFFSKISHVRLFKARCYVAERPSFYLIATNVQSQSPLAMGLMERCKTQWRTAALGSDDECKTAFGRYDGTEEARLVEDFGPELVVLGRDVWSTQARALTMARLALQGQGQGQG